jgi:hypothetical protein
MGRGRNARAEARRRGGEEEEVEALNLKHEIRKEEEEVKH